MPWTPTPLPTPMPRIFLALALAAALLCAQANAQSTTAAKNAATNAATYATPSAAAAPPSGTALIQAPTLANVPATKLQGAGFLDNPYGLQALWQQGDAVAKITLLLLLIMSLYTWYVLIAKLLEQWRFKAYARAAQTPFWQASSVRKACLGLHAQSPFRAVADAALAATQAQSGLLRQVDRSTWLTQSIQDAVSLVHSRSNDGLAVLATVGSTAPFVGLFGTVWGIYNALVKIGASGQASIDKVAGPVGEALIMTALGLAVAVPAVLGYNWLVRRNKLAMDAVKMFGSGLHTVLQSRIESPSAGTQNAAAETVPAALHKESPAHGD